MFEIFRIVVESTTFPHFHDNEPKTALNVKAWLPDLHSKLEFTLTFHHHNVQRAALHTLHGAERRWATRRKVG